MPRFDSPACFAALARRPDARSLADRAGVAESVRRAAAIAIDSLVLETEFTTETRNRRGSIDCMPPRQSDPDLVRIVEGVRGEVRDADGAGDPLRLRIDRALGAPGRRRASRDRRSRRACRCWTPVETRGVDLTTRRGVHRRSRASACRSCWSGTRRTDAARPIDADRRASTTRPSGGRPGPRAARTTGQWRDAVLRSLHHAQGADVRADRRHRRRADDVAARADRRRAQLGLPLLLAARRDVHAVRADDRRLHRRGGRVAQLAAARGRRRSGAAADHVRPGRRAAAHRDASCRGCRATRDRSRCASATRRRTSSSSTSTAR